MILVNRYFGWIAGVGCTALILTVVIGLGGLLIFRSGTGGVFQVEGSSNEDDVQAAQSDTPEAATDGTTDVVATPMSPAVWSQQTRPREEAFAVTDPSTMEEGTLAALYADVHPGVVNIQIYAEQFGVTRAGAGSGFILDDEGHIVTNQHVVAEASFVTVVFYDGTEVEAEIVGTDADSDLAVVKVDQLPEGVHPLSLGASSAMIPGDWVIAIGNPFSLGSSMTLGIVSAVGRSIPTAETPFSIPSAIQTDAAINPGNSGGPLLNLDGQVVGVNAQIQSTTGTNSGVGFAIPSDVLELVVPTLIEQGAYVWPWLGVSGTDVGLLVQETNDLPRQNGAYIVEVVDDGPAAEAGLQGASGERRVLGQAVPVGGDVVIEIDGEPIENFTELLTGVAFRAPGDRLELTILRGGELQRLTVELVERPANLR